MSKAATGYFDHYLDGKLATPPAGSAETAQRAMKKSSTGKASRSSASLFKVRDKNKDGALTLEEFIGDPANRNLPVLTKRFNGWDTDKDGKVTLKEMQGGN
jgi:Ca2+-binding EF-hand superfamily protein